MTNHPVGQVSNLPVTVWNDDEEPRKTRIRADKKQGPPEGGPCFHSYPRKSASSAVLRFFYVFLYTSSRIGLAASGSRYCGRPDWSMNCVCGSIPKTWKIVAISSFGWIAVDLGTS